MGDYITPEDYSRVVQSMGLKGAQDWVRKHNITIADGASGGLPPQSVRMEARMEDEGELPPIGSDETDTEDTLSASPSAGALGSLDAFRAYEKAQQAVNAQITANIDLLTSARDTLRERRAGPSNAERWFAIAAALGKPTRTGSFGESLGNLGEVLGEQQAARRKAEEERDMLLEQYGLKIGNEQLRLAQSGATQAGQVYRATAAADAARARAGMPKMVYSEGDWRIQPGTGGVPPLNAKGQYVVSTPEEAASVPKGKPFVYKGGNPNDVYWGQ